jgi:hypothetical protein
VWTASGQRLKSGFCEHGDEPFDSVIRRNYLVIQAICRGGATEKITPGLLTKGNLCRRRAVGRSEIFKGRATLSSGNCVYHPLSYSEGQHLVTQWFDVFLMILEDAVLQGYDAGRSGSVGPDVSNDRGAFIFGVRQSSSVTAILTGPCTMIFRNVDNCLPNIQQHCCNIIIFHDWSWSWKRRVLPPS